MTLTAALILLLSASDAFPADWQLWDGVPLRGIPNRCAIVNIDGDSCLKLQMEELGQDAYPYFSDLTKPFPRPVTRDEHPYCETHIWLPPFSKWPMTANQVTPANPNGGYNYAGWRVTMQRLDGALFWPGIFLTGPASNPHWTVRLGTDFPAQFPITQSGWWTLGMGWKDVPSNPIWPAPDGYWHGVIQFYAAPGKVALTDADRLTGDESLNPTQMRSVNGWFLDCAVQQGETFSSPWYFGDVTLYAQPALPVLDIARDNEQNYFLTMHDGYPAQPYTLQRSSDLAAWLDVTAMMNGYTVTIPDAGPKRFYRLSP